MPSSLALMMLPSRVMNCVQVNSQSQESTNNSTVQSELRTLFSVGIQAQGRKGEKKHSKKTKMEVATVFPKDIQQSEAIAHSSLNWECWNW